MGLSVTAYEVAELLPEHKDSDDCNDHVVAFTLAEFEASGAGLEPERHYRGSGQRAERSWSYTGYGAFREALSRAALGVAPETVWEAHENGRDTFSGQPFVLLINFADNEGTIGPAAAATLADEFAAQADQVRLRLTDLTHRLDYDWWAAATRLAAGRGVIEFL
jgi:hypothetical protein